jgi:hypothetical protein
MTLEEEIKSNFFLKTWMLKVNFLPANFYDECCNVATDYFALVYDVIKPYWGLFDKVM